MVRLLLFFLSLGVIGFGLLNEVGTDGNRHLGIIALFVGIVFALIMAITMERGK